jgi:hypothetical protein
MQARSVLFEKKRLRPAPVEDAACVDLAFWEKSSFFVDIDRVKVTIHAIL